jgi:hypothetical protein
MLLPAQISQIQKQLGGRYPYGAYKIASKCICKKALVVKVKSRILNNKPFPTTFYLIDSKLIKEVSRLESAGFMNDLNNELKNNLKLREKLLSAHYNYLSHRYPKNTQEIANISAGGMPNRVKCLHSYLAHTLSVGLNINPIGDIVYKKIYNKKLPFLSECFGHIHY